MYIGGVGVLIAVVTQGRYTTKSGRSSHTEAAYPVLRSADMLWPKAGSVCSSNEPSLVDVGASFLSSRRTRAWKKVSSDNSSPRGPSQFRPGRNKKL